MTDHIQKLAEAECPIHYVAACATDGQVPMCKDTCDCHGSGALVPDLRRECSELRLQIQRGWLGKTMAHGPMRNHDCTECQGRGWALIPEVEIMGVLVRFDKNITVWWWKDHWAAISGDRRFNQGIGETPEAALAHAICQSLDVA